MVLLRTERLILREIAIGDVPALHEIEGHPDVARWIWLPPPPVEAVANNVSFIVQQAAESPRTIYVFGIVLRGETRIIGRCGFDISGLAKADGMLGYAVQHNRWGQGYATEAVRALLDFGFGELRLHRMWADCDVRNVGSWRVLEKAGMRREGHMVENYKFQGEWCDSYHYAMLDREWPGAGTR